MDGCGFRCVGRRGRLAMGAGGVRRSGWVKVGVGRIVRVGLAIGVGVGRIVSGVGCRSGSGCVCGPVRWV